MEPRPVTDLDKRQLLAKLLEERARSTNAVMPLSYGQRALWFVHRMAPESHAYNVFFGVRINSVLDVDALRRAGQTLMGRHAILRTRFTNSDSGPIQSVAGYLDVPFAHQLAPGVTDAELIAIVQGECRRPFDLSKGPMVRLHLVSRAPEDHILLMVLHHIVTDGWSTGILVSDLWQAYAAETGAAAQPLARVEHTYGDYVRWHTALVENEPGREDELFWRAELDGMPTALELPFDRPRPLSPRHVGASIPVEISAKVAAGLDEVGRAAGVTLFSVLLAGYQILLSRWSGQSDIVVGTPTAGRTQEEFQSVVGYFVNPVALRTSVTGGMDVRSLLVEVGRRVSGALAHQNYPFALLVERLHPERAANRSPVFQVMFNLLKARGAGLLGALAAGEAVDHAGLRLQPISLRAEEAQFDLTLDIVDTARGLRAELRYDLDLFDEGTVRQMAAHLEAILARIASRDALRVSDAWAMTDQTAASLKEWNNTFVPVLADSALARIGQQVQSRSGHIAVRCGNEELSYGDLDRRSTAIAAALRQHGVGRGALVGVGLARSTDMIAALVAVWKAGAAFVPIDPSLPRERAHFMLDDAGIEVLLTASNLQHVWEGWRGTLLDPAACGVPREFAPAEPVPSDFAYVIYTSGSTGVPKGVAVTHGNLANLLSSLSTWTAIVPGDRLVAVATLSFDIAMAEIFMPLTNGATVLLATGAECVDGGLLRQLLQRRQATMMQSTPPQWRLLIDAGWEGTPGLRMICGGEAMTTDLKSQLLQRGAALWNFYGPTETTVISTGDRMAADRPITIGRPLANTTVHVLDERLQPMPIGVPGELLIGGSGVAAGYWSRTALTAERFLPDPFSTLPGARMYRTGDVARFVPDGRLEYFGRADHQVKIRSHRIEAGEVEAAIVAQPGIRQAVVVARPDNAGSHHLVAYVVGDNVGDGARLREALKATLPDYMVPSHVVPLASVPLTPNGKVDRRALPAPSGASSARVGYLAPESVLERRIAEIWQQVLDGVTIGRHDNFFDLGGHSLLFARVQAPIQELAGRPVPMVELYQYPTVAGIAAHLSGAAADDSGLEEARARARRQRRAFAPAASRSRQGGSSQ
jgi:amino acid adenylation domain-containing protein